MEQNRHFRNKSIPVWTLIVDKGTKAIQWRKDSSSTNDAGTWISICKNMNFNLYLTQETKLNQNGSRA